MQRKMAMTFDNWLNEEENYGLRIQRLFETFSDCDVQMLLTWLKTAYTIGYEEGRKDGKAQS